MTSATQKPFLSLQRIEAEERRALLDVTSYDVSLDLASDTGTFESTTVVRFTSRGGRTFVDVKPVTLHEARLNGQPISLSLLDRGRLPLETAAGENELVVRATMRFRNDGEGLHRSVDPADGRAYVYGMSFMDAAPSVFACFDQPDLKAPYTFHVTAPNDWTVTANAAGRPVEAGPGDSTRWEFEESLPLSTYFVTVVAGPYYLVESEHDGIPLSLGARASLASALDRDADELFTLTRQSFDEYHRLFGIRYPFGKYHQAFVPEFNAGAMENPGCVTIRDPLLYSSRPTRGSRLFRAALVAHEMAHQWFGNTVTPVWWDDLWLNESFAEYMGYRVTADVTEYSDAWADTSYARRQWGLVADQSPSTHPVAGNGAVDALAALQDFDGISYAKGSSILKQLAASLGDDVFFGGVVDHLTRHRFGNATMHDLIDSWERAGAGDLGDLSAQWLTKAGPDRLQYRRDSGLVLRTPPAAHPAERSHTFRAAVERDGVWHSETVSVEGPETPVALTGGAILLDPYNDTWAVPLPDAETIAALPALLPSISDPGLRAGVWNNIRNAYHNALVAPSAVIDLAVASFPVEDVEDTPRRTIAWLFRDVVPTAPAGSLARLHEATLAKLAGADAGSEHQLAALRAAIRSSADETELRGWLAATPEGIDLDTDLRWRVLGRLAQLGAVDRQELASAFESNQNAEARVAYTGALCALPDAEAKRYSWSVFSGETDLPNYEVVAAGRGMWNGPASLTARYVDAYFDEVPSIVEHHSGWVVADLTAAFFPADSLTAETLAQARRVIEAPGLDLTLRRTLIDCTDLLGRRLAALGIEAPGAS